MNKENNLWDFDFEQEKDSLTAGLITALQPSNDDGWGELLKRAPDFLALLKSIDEERQNYPESELEGLKLLDKLTARVEYQYGDRWVNRATARGLEEGVVGD